jgi:type VI secretion system protein ImpC
MSEEKKASEAPAEIVQVLDSQDTSKSLLDKVIDFGELNKDEAQKEFAKDIITNFATEFSANKIKIQQNLYKAIDARIAEIDSILTSQINEIIHNKAFQALECSWRSIFDLVQQAEPDDALKIKILDVKKKDLLADFEAAADFDQSGLFELLYEKEYGTFGGEPYGMIVGDYEFSRGVQDIALLKGISQVASSAHAPFMSAASPQLFNMNDFTELNKPRDLGALFNSAEFGSWKAFRKTEESRYVTLAMPRVIGRKIYGGQDGLPVETFNFTEHIHNEDGSSNYLWSNCAYKLTTRIVDSFRNFGWFNAIRGVENGGTVTDLPIHSYVDENGDKAFKMPVETVITDRREKELDELGFTSLIYKRGTDSATFFGSKTIYMPDEYENPVANANSQVNIVLPYIMAVSRFAHYLKVIMRDKVGGFSSKENVDAYLNGWISKFVIAKDSPTNFEASRFPLREARVQVIDDPSKPGSYSAVIHLRPHYYFNDIKISMRLVSKLPGG